MAIKLWESAGQWLSVYQTPHGFVYSQIAVPTFLNLKTIRKKQ